VKHHLPPAAGPRAAEPSAPAGRSHWEARGGFTLVELLAVILIVGMLMGILTPVVMQSLTRARVSGVKAEIDMLHMAIMNYKNEHGSFPPDNMAGLWDDTASPPRVNTNHPTYRHLKRLFPRIREREQDNGPSDRSPYFFMAQMSPAQAMVFWLQGFYQNPLFPLTNNIALSDAAPRTSNATAARRKLFDFDESRLYGASTYWTPSNPPTLAGTTFQTFFADRNTAPAFARDYPVYFPGSYKSSLPYAYFTAVGAYSNSTAPTAGPIFRELAYRATPINGANTIARPYLTSAATLNSSWAECHWNSDTFQLIAAGIDNMYGDIGSSFPVCVPKQFPFSSWNGVTLGTVPAATETGVMYHEDNITNFAIGTLRDAAQRQ